MVLFVVVTQLCAFGALDEIPVTNFRALQIGTDPVHGLINGKKKICGPSQNRDDPIVGSALRTRILAIQKSDHAIQNILCSVTKS